MEGRDGRNLPPTTKKRQDERRRGRLCVSQEILHWGGLVLGLIGLRLAIPFFGNGLTETFRCAFRLEATPVDAAAVVSGFRHGGWLLLRLLAPVFAGTMLGAVAASWGQTGPYFSAETLRWNWDALSPARNARELFSLHMIPRLLVALAKIAVVAGVTGWVIAKGFSTLATLHRFPCALSWLWLSNALLRVILGVVAIFLVVAVLDWGLQKYRYEQSLMMTREEFRDEARQQEISPVIRRVQYRKMRELARHRMMTAVPRAAVVLTNPVMVAVALEYDPRRMAAPRVAAKGMRKVAERIRAIAQRHGVPIVERPELARLLYRHVRLGQEIPSRFYEAVAAVLAYLHRIGRGIRLLEE